MNFLERSTRQGQSTGDAFDLRTVLVQILTPLEFLVFLINMTFFAHYCFNYDSVQRAAPFLNHKDAIRSVDLMCDLDLLVIMFVGAKVCLTASHCVSFDLKESVGPCKEPKCCAPSQDQLQSQQIRPSVFGNSGRPSKPIAKLIKPKGKPGKPSDASDVMSQKN